MCKSSVIYSNFTLTFNKDLISYMLLGSLIVVLFLPLISEIDFFGVIKIKKDMRDFKKDVNERILFFQNTITNSINLDNKISLNLYVDAIKQLNELRFDENEVLPYFTYEIRPESQKLRQKAVDKVTLKKVGKEIQRLRGLF